MPESSQSERELVRRCLAREPAAWEEFIRAYAPVVERAVRRTLDRYGPGRADLAPDLVQEVLSSLAHPDKSPLIAFRWESSLSWFLATVASRQAFFALTKRQDPLHEQGLRELARSLPSAAPGPSAQAPEGSQVLDRLGRAIEALPPRARLAIQLFYWESLPVETIAPLFGVSGSGVHKLLARAREALRRSLRSVRGLLL